MRVILTLLGRRVVWIVLGLFLVAHFLELLLDPLHLLFILRQLVLVDFFNPADQLFEVRLLFLALGLSVLTVLVVMSFQEK